METACKLLTLPVKVLLGLGLVACLSYAAFWQGSASPLTPRNISPLRCNPAPLATASPRPDMVWVPAGKVDIGDTVYPEEQPIQSISIAGFWMDRTEVTNAQFAAFVLATGYVTVAERPVDMLAHPGLPPELRRAGAVVFTMPHGLRNDGDLRQWWQYRAGANWRHPGGPDSSIVGLDAFPVVAVTIEDAQAFARWRGTSLPSEAEWEWAARGGLQVALGQTEQPPHANTWQGIFPIQNTAIDGFSGVAPVACFAPNGYGLFDMIGNVWELTRDQYLPHHDARDNRPPDQESLVLRSGQTFGQRVIKGGSYLCAPNYCMRYRAGARQGQDDDLATSHLGFRTILRDTASVAAPSKKP